MKAKSRRFLRNTLLLLGLVFICIVLQRCGAGPWSGQGTVTLSHGRKYVGEFKYGKFNGYGKMTYRDGSKYIGEWKNGDWNGQAIYTWPNKGGGEFKYVGEFKNGRITGNGVCTYPDGTKDGEEIKISK